MECMPDRPWKEGEPRQTRIVFIGKDLVKDPLEEGFKACVWSEEDDAWVEEEVAAQAT